MVPDSSSLSSLTGKTFVLELSRDIRFKAKQELINYLRKQNAQISYILTASTDYVLVSNDVDTYKTRRAKQLGIPLINVEYIYECRNSSIGKEPIDIKRFIVTSAEDKENFSKSGTIPVSGGGSSSTGPIKQMKIDLSKIKIWNDDDVELPRFDEITHAEIGKWAIFKETNEHSDVYFALELQIIPEEFNHQSENDYRIRFRYEKQTITSSKGKISLIQYAFSNDMNELHQLFASYYTRIATMPRITRIRDLLPDKLGSKLLLRSLFVHRIDTQMLDEHVCQLIESLWIESIGDLNKILSVQPESIALQTIIEAEAALLEIKSDSKSSSEAEARFYSLIPHRSSFIVDLVTNRRALIDKTDLCQMLRDMLTVNELTNWNVKASIEAKYRALKCHIETIEHDTQEYTNISDMITTSTNSNEKVVVHQIYSVAKQTDALNFRSTLSNQKQLFHGSKYNNFLGILSRGLLLPKIVVNDLGITRTDFGCLGYGIYFSDSVSTSLKYTTSSTTRPGRRLLCISQVALGDSAKFYSYAPNLIQPPENFHSTHGVKKSSENNSKFVDDEFAVYNLDQQRLLYIVELSWTPFDDHTQSFNSLPIVRDVFSNRTKFSTDEIDIPTTIEDEVIQVAEQDYGLICPSSGQLVPLKAFHIRAQLIDITAEVVLYQVYHNTSSVPIEAKYVFPLDENCSICGFEAHINNKIIKGVVKEKEQAKREYREAIEKGHGAYLMHQEQAEVFSVSVGNLPANCEVIIKITYVAELSIENNDIIFRFPAKVASWQSKQALDMKDQILLPSIHLEQENSSMKSVEFSLKASIQMPYEINKLFSPTHRLRRKITDCIAMIELVDNILLDKDFLLSITLKSVNLPRMLNETSDLSDENSQACMLTFYPKFEMLNSSNEYVEIVFIIDVSNSMDGKHVQQAKQLAHLFLTNMKYNDGSIYFNIITFGSDNDECFPISSPNTKENIDKAKHFVLHSLDHRGNTDLFSVLRQYSLIPSSSSKLGRQFILLSDGHITDLKATLNLLEKQSTMRHDRFFTCSIGDTPNKHYLKQLANQANAGGLNTIFDSNYRSRWKNKVVQILEHIHQPCVTNISIDWHGTIDNLQEKFTDQAPKFIRSLFNGMRLTVYRFIRNCHKATLTATINDQEFVTTVFSNKMTETKGRILHCLTARAIIQDYENGLLHHDQSENELIKKQYKQDLIDLSMKYSVVSSFTSFVAIEERDGEALEPGVRLLDVMLEHDLDLLPYIGWDGERSQIDLLKDKLINAKHLFDSASISNKIQLTNEYEELCKNISYRSGGEAKYQLMLTIIDTYRTVCKENEKARELQEKMKDDLINEMNNATADERHILEKRLDEIDTCFKIEESEASDDQSSSSEEDDDEWQVDDDDELDEYASNAVTSKQMDSKDDSDLYMRFLKTEARRSLCIEEISIAEPDENESYEPTMNLFDMGTNVESDEDEGYDIFNPMPSKASHPASSKIEIRPSPPKAEAKKQEEEEEEDDDDGDAMGFGLFDDNFPSFSTAATGQKEEKLADEEATRSIKRYEKALSPTGAANDASGRQTIDALSDVCPRLEKRKMVFSTDASRGISNLSLEDDLRSSLSFDDINLPLNEMFNDPYAMISPLQSVAFSPISDSGALVQNLNATSLFGDEAPMPQPVPPGASSLFAQSASTVLNDGVRTPSVLSGFTGSLPSATTASVSLPSSSGTLFSFPQSTTAVNVNYMPTSPAFTKFDSSSSFSAAASVLPPPSSLPNQQASSLLSGLSQTASTNSHIHHSSIFGGFGSAPKFSFAECAPPPAVPSSVLFGSSSTTKSNIFGMPAQQPSQMSMHSISQSTPPPPPPPPSIFQRSVPSATSAPAFSFGAASSIAQQQSIPFGNISTGTFTTTSSWGAPPPPPPPSIFQPPPPPPPPSTFQHPVPFATAAPAFSFGAASSTAQQQSIPFGNISTDTFATTSSWGAPLPPPPPPPPANFQLPLPPAPATSSFSFGVGSSTAERRPVPLGNISSSTTTTSSCWGAPSDTSPRSSSMGHRSETTEAQRELQEMKLTVEQEQSSISHIDESDSSSQNRAVHFCDTRSDEQEKHYSHETTFDKDQSRDSLVNKKKKALKSKTSHIPEKSVLQDLLLLDVTPLGYGIEDINGHMCTIIERNRTIPLKSSRYAVFTNAYAYQTTATIRVFCGQHKLTKYNTFIGELILTGLTPNFVSQVLEISICMDIDANGVLEVEAEESRSGAKAKIRFDSDNYRISQAEIERHITYVESDPSFRALPVAARQADDPLYMLKGETENAKINFTNVTEISEDFPSFANLKNIELNSFTINELKRIQSADGSFDLNEDLANLLAINANHFDALKKYLGKQGFNSFALNVQTEIVHLIATGIILMQLFFQVPRSERKIYLVPFDREEIRSIFHRHLPQILTENFDRALDFYEQKRRIYGIYCEQLELNYSTWDKFIQYSLFHIDN